MTIENGQASLFKVSDHFSLSSLLSCVIRQER